MNHVYTGCFCCCYTHCEDTLLPNSYTSYWQLCTDGFRFSVTDQCLIKPTQIAFLTLIGVRLKQQPGWRWNGDSYWQERKSKEVKRAFSSPLKAPIKANLSSYYSSNQCGQFACFHVIICAGEEITLIALPMFENSLYRGVQSSHIKESPPHTKKVLKCRWFTVIWFSTGYSGMAQCRIQKGGEASNGKQHETFLCFKLILTLEKSLWGCSS